MPSLLRSPIRLSSPSSPHFQPSAYSDIQSWLNGIVDAEQSLASPIDLPQHPRATCLSSHFCPPISRKKRVVSSLDDDSSPQGGCSRPIRRVRFASRRNCNSPWRLPPSRRFFESANWMDEADKKLASSLATEDPDHPLTTWRDAYSVMISASPASRSRRPNRVIRSLSPTPISLPVCPPLNLSSPLRTPEPVQPPTRPNTPPLIDCHLDALSSISDSRSDMPATPQSSHSELYP